MRTRTLLSVLFLAVVLWPVFAETELTLVDGQVIRGVDVRRDGDTYLVQLESGDEIAIPAELVASVGLAAAGDSDYRPKNQARPSLASPRPAAAAAPGHSNPPARDGSRPSARAEGGAGSPPPPQASESETRSGRAQRDGAFRYGKGETLAGDIPEGPSGLRTSESQTLAGKPVRGARPGEQLEVFGGPAAFQQDIVSNDWVPTTDWDMDPEKNNNFAPSTWSEGVIDPGWEPESAFDADTDVMAGSRSTFQDGVIDSTWTPTDGF